MPPFQGMKKWVAASRSKGVAPGSHMPPLRGSGHGTVMAAGDVTERRRAIAVAKALAHLADKLPSARLWLDYDEEADVLYISLKRPQEATETIEVNGGAILLRYRKKELVGITVLDAS